ncbi:MAG: hypothetical protein NTW19_12275 [Planctomycetota bacterium]|nr:hypothetical protein [Planctomycetota bacterium]
MIRSSLRSSLARLALVSLLASMLVACAAAGPAPAQAQAQKQETPPAQRPRLLAEFDRRVDVARDQLALVEKAADAAAQRIVAHNDALINVPYAPQGTFAEEILNRAGGLAQALPPEERAKAVTPNDVLLCSARCWEADGAKVRAMVEQGRKQGWLIVLFASRAGMPEDVNVDFLIDNGAKAGGKDEASMNAITNILNAWLWCCEYTSALTRAGKYPGVLQSILVPASKEHNAAIQSPQGRYFLGKAEKSIGKGQLAKAYLARVEKLQKSMAEPAMRESIEKAADVIGDRLKADGKVVVASCTHFLMGEVMAQPGIKSRTPMLGIQAVWQSKVAFKNNVGPGGLILWFGYVGMSTPYEDYGGAIRAMGVPFVACCVPEPGTANDPADAAVRIDLSWRPPDAEVELPFPPGRMAPVSGIEQGLTYRLLEEAVAARLAGAGKP